jgi:hypothetical protein
METDPVTETLCFQVIYNSGQWTKFINALLLSVASVLEIHAASIFRGPVARLGEKRNAYRLLVES